MTTENERVDRLVEESSYVFKATVTQLNASNEPAVRPGPGLIVAHVDEAFRASPSVGCQRPPGPRCYATARRRRASPWRQGPRFCK